MDAKEARSELVEECKNPNCFFTPQEPLKICGRKIGNEWIAGPFVHCQKCHKTKDVDL